MADGRSPVQEKQREKRRLSRAKTFAEFTEVWMEASGMADSTRAMRKHVIDHDILPVFQNRLLVEISPDDLRALCMKVKKRGAPATASLAASSMSGAGVEGVGMNTSYTAHAGENTQASIPWIVGKMPASKVYKNHEKVTISELLWDYLNYQVLVWVYKKCILVTMSDQNERKLNRLLAGLGDTGVVSSRWLRAHGYSSSLIVRYVDSGWLVSPARGVYMRKGGALQWEGVVRTLQCTEGLSLHVGGRFALAWQGHEHYLRLGEAAVITLYGPDRLPGWVGKLPLTERVEYCGKGPFDLPALPLTDETTDQALLDQGLERREATRGGMVVCSTAERAMLELCDDASDASGVYEADALMQGMATLRPQRLERLLRHCHSIKAKRLFLALAERHGHAWPWHLSLDGVDLGRGKRSLVPGGRLHPRYQITLPGDLDEQLG